MTIPHPVRVGVLVIAATSFYTYVGQMVPQKEVLPPQETVIRADLTTADMVKVGREIMDGKGLCFTCHTIGRTGALRFPDLEGVDTRAQTRVPGLTDIQYFAQSIYEPEKFIVPGFNPGMPVINKPPIGLNDQEILCVIAYLQTLGGMPTVTLQTSHQYYTPAGAAPGAPAPAAASAPGAAPGVAPAPGAAPGGAPAPATAPAPGAAPGVAPAPATTPAPGAKPPAPAAPTKGTR
jgi:cytochrome c2